MKLATWKWLHSKGIVAEVFEGETNGIELSAPPTLAFKGETHWSNCYGTAAEVERQVRSDVKYLSPCRITNCECGKWNTPEKHAAALEVMGKVIAQMEVEAGYARQRKESNAKYRATLLKSRGKLPRKSAL